MSGLISRVQLVSNALLLLGGNTISSLTENSTGAKLGANLFENTYLSMLQNHRWRFAAKTQELNQLAATPNTGFNYAYQMPNDFLYTIKGSGNTFEAYDNEIHCNDKTFQLDYIHRVSEDVIPPYFAKALEYNLASQFAVPLTGDIAKGDYYERKFNSEIRKAKFADSSQYPEVSVQNQPYIDIRY